MSVDGSQLHVPDEVSICLKGLISTLEVRMNFDYTSQNIVRAELRELGKNVSVL